MFFLKQIILLRVTCMVLCKWSDQRRTMVLFSFLICEVASRNILIVVLYHHTDWGNTEIHNKRKTLINFTSLFLLSGDAAPNVGRGDAGVGRMVGGSWGRIWSAGSRVLQPPARGVQEIRFRGQVAGSTEGQLLLLQQLDLLFQLMLPLLLLMDTLRERTTVLSAKSLIVTSQKETLQLLGWLHPKDGRKTLLL